MGTIKKSYTQEELKLIVGLYKHEDNLLWAKVKFVMLFDSALFVAWNYLSNKTGANINYSVAYLIPMVGMVANLLLAVSLHGSKQHLTAYRTEASENLFPLGKDFAGKPFLGLPTSTVMIALVLCVAITWAVIVILQI